VTLNAASFTSGQTVSINVTESNTQNTANNVSAAKDWPISGLTLGGCGTLNYPFGISIYQGYYDLNNVSLLASQSSLHFYQPGVYSCPAMFVMSQYAFAPSSDVAGGAAMSSVISTNGTWTGVVSSSTFHEFAPGVYTVVGGDEWGDVAVVHFTVTG
jgi:hypothetical protein